MSLLNNLFLFYLSLRHILRNRIMKSHNIMVSIRLILLAIPLLFSLSSCGSNDGPELTFIHTNDTHSQIDGIYLDERPVGGVIERASFLELMRQDDPQLVYLDAGDMVQGSPYFNIWDGKVEMKAMNLQGLIASTFGNHEFDNGIDFLSDMLNYACFPIVSCNYDVKGTSLEKFVRPSMVIERKGVKIGITGVTVDPNNLIFNRNWEGITYIDPSEAANKEAKNLKERGCDIVVLLSHVGYVTSDSLGDRRIAANSTDIDLIIGGHTHTNLENGELVNNLLGKPVMITQTGAKASPIGYINIKTKKAGKHADGTQAYAIKSISCKKLHPDLFDLRVYGRIMSDFIAPYRDSLDMKMGTVLGLAAHDMPRFRPQSPLGNFASDVLREGGTKFYGKPMDVGIMNVGGLRNDLYAGDIKLGDIYRIFPFENTLSILEIKGADLEEAIHQIEGKKLEAISGMQITLQTIDEHPRAVDMKVDGKPIDPERIYYVATIDYLAEGNDGLYALTKAVKNTNSGILLRNLMVDYVKEMSQNGKQIDGLIDNRIIELPDITTEDQQ